MIDQNRCEFTLSRQITGNWKLGWSRQYCVHILSSFSQTFASTNFFPGGIGRENRISEPVFKMLKKTILAQSFANAWDRSKGRKSRVKVIFNSN